MKKLLAACLFCAAIHARAETSNGNDFALALVEAKTPADRLAVIEDAQGRPHYFRYLQIQQMTEAPEGDGVQIVAREPASGLAISFTVSKPNSLALLRDAPVTKVGDAIAISAKFSNLNAEGTIQLDSPIVRQKDRLSPKVGKELLSETNPGAVVYSYTEGPRPVTVEARDRDLLQHRDKILKEGGPTAWCEFLEREIAKRKQQRAAEAAGRNPR